MELSIQIHKPYCGGAKPTDVIGKGTTEPYANETFYLKSAMSNSKRDFTIKVLKTDDQGQVKFKAAPGKYVLIHIDKTMSFENYLKKFNTPDEAKFLTYVGDEAAKAQFSKADFEITLEAGKAISISYQSACFSGLNPCLKYTGPKPQ